MLKQYSRRLPLGVVLVSLSKLEFESLLVTIVRAGEHAILEDRLNGDVTFVSELSFLLAILWLI